MSLQIEEVCDRARLSQYSSEWAALALASPDADLYHTFEWITTWLDAFWPDKPLLFLLVRRAGRLVGIAPFLHDEAGELWCADSLVTPINEDSARTTVLSGANATEVLEAILQYLCAKRRDVRVAFKKATRASRVVQKLPEMLSQFRMSAVMLEEPGSPFLDLTVDKEEYFRSRSGHFLHELRRKRRRITRAGIVRHEIVTSSDAYDHALADIMEIERNSWKEEPGTAFTSKASLAKFYANFGRMSTKRGWLRIHLLYVDEKPIAHLFGVAYKDCYYALKTSYHKGFGKYSPGVALFDRALDDAFSLSLSRFDLLGEPARWKDDMATGVSEQVHLCIFSRGRFKCQCCRLVRGHVWPFMKKRAPIVVKIRKKIRDARQRLAVVSHGVAVGWALAGGALIELYGAQLTRCWLFVDLS